MLNIKIKYIIAALSLINALNANSQTITVDTSASLGTIGSAIFDSAGATFDQVSGSGNLTATDADSNTVDRIGFYEGDLGPGNFDDDGLILSTGDALNAPRANGRIATDCQVGGNWTEQTTDQNTAHVIFTFEAEENAITLKYLIASNEYPNDSTISDACADEFGDFVVFKIRVEAASTWAATEEIAVYDVLDPDGDGIDVGENADNRVGPNWSTTPSQQSYPTISYNGAGDVGAIDFSGLTVGVKYDLYIGIVNGNDSNVDSALFIPTNGITK